MRNFLILTILLSFISATYAQRKPDPPKLIDGDQLIAENFNEVYTSLNYPRFSIQTVVASGTLDTSSLANVISDISAIDSAIKSALLKSTNMNMALSSPGIYRINDTEPNQVINGIIDPWGYVRYQVTTESSSGVMEQLQLDNPVKAASTLGIRDDAEIVLLIKLLLSSRGIDGEYVLLDVNRNQLLATHSWKFSNENVTSDDWRTEYGKAIAVHAMKSFAQRKGNLDHQNERNCELVIRTNVEINFDKLTSIIENDVPQIVKGSVQYKGEEAAGSRATYSFTYRIHGELSTFRRDLVEQINSLSSEDLTVYLVSDNLIELEIGDFTDSQENGSPDFAYLKQCVPNIQVTIVDKNGAEAIFTGSGIVVSSSGHVLTNKHVVEGDSYTVKSITAIFENGDDIEAELVFKSNRLDVAVLKIPSRVEKLRFARSYSIGDKVFAFGYPTVASNLVRGISNKMYSQEVDVDFMAFTVTQGVLSSIEEAGSTYGKLLITDAAIYPGNSGGPLTDSLGNVIGMNTIGHSEAQSVNGAIAWQSIRDDLLSAGFNDIIWP